MTDPDHYTDHDIHAFIDGEMSIYQRQKMLESLEHEPALRERACNFQRGKEWVHAAFADVEPPERDNPQNGRRRCRPVFSMGLAASFMVVVVAFAAGWLLHQSTRQAPLSAVALNDIASSQYRVVLHIDQSDHSKFDLALNEAESLLQRYRDKGIKVELLANSTGINLLQKDGNNAYLSRLQKITREYDNLTLLACSNALERLREKGIEPNLIEGTYTGESAVEHIIQRLQEGWTYIKV